MCGYNLKKSRTGNRARKSIDSVNNEHGNVAKRVLLFSETLKKIDSKILPFSRFTTITFIRSFWCMVKASLFPSEDALQSFYRLLLQIGMEVDVTPLPRLVTRVCNIASRTYLEVLPARDVNMPPHPTPSQQTRWFYEHDFRSGNDQILLASSH